MKKLIIAILFISTTVCSHAQSQPQIGVFAEGGWFFPSMSQESSSISLKDGVATGVGFYASTPIIGKLSASLGLGYRYKGDKFQLEHSTTPGIHYGTPPSTEYYIRKYPQSYLTVPLNLRFSLGKRFFITSGIELAWLLNYKYVKEKPEFSWLLGVGYSTNRLEYSLNLVEGLGEQGMGKQQDVGYGQEFNSHMLTLKVTCPLWKKKAN